MCDDFDELAERFADQVEILELFVDAAQGASVKQLEREYAQQARREEARRESIRKCVARFRAKHRKGVTVDEQTCPYCGKVFPVIVGDRLGGRPKRFCRQSHRQRWYEKRRRQAPAG